eukprot:811715-Rhodomonas_salina.1
MGVAISMPSPPPASPRPTRVVTCGYVMVTLWSRYGQVWNCANGGWTHTGGSFFRKGLCGVDAT